MACAETLQVDVTAGVGEVWVELNRLVARLFGEGVTVKLYCSRMPLKLGRESRDPSMASSRDFMIRKNVRVMSSDEEEETELSRVW